MCGIVLVQRPWKGCLVHRIRFAGRGGQGQAKADRNSGAPVGSIPEIEATKRVGGVRVKPRTRLSLADPKRAKPKGAASGRRVKPRPTARDSRKGQSPGTAARWAGPALRRRDYRRVKRYVGPSAPETRRIPSERGKLRRANPMSAAGVKQNRHGLGGSKPPRG
jgi:hypothetical protein